MKTLDEVIEDLELTGSVNAGFRAEHEEVLYWLKMYRSDQIQWKADRENLKNQYRQEAEKFNKATEKHLLALKELKQKEAEFKEARDRHFTAYRILEERLRERNEDAR